MCHDSGGLVNYFTKVRSNAGNYHVLKVTDVILGTKYPEIKNALIEGIFFICMMFTGIYFRSWYYLLLNRIVLITFPVDVSKRTR
jgi:hypothetical protein